MNFFKVTLISAMVAGLTCANVSAGNDSTEDFTTSYDAQEFQKPVDQDLVDTRNQAAKDLESGLSHGAKALGWLGLSGLSGAAAYHQFVGSLWLLGLTVQNLQDLVSVVDLDSMLGLLSSEVAKAALYATGTYVFFSAATWSAYMYGALTVETLRNAINHMKATITD